MNLPIQWTPERIVKQHQAARPNATLGRELPRLDACLKKWVATKDTNAAGKTLVLCFALAGRFKSPTAELIGRRIIATFDGREQELASAVDRRYRAFVPAACRSGVKRSAVADLEKRIYPCSRGVVFDAELHREMKKRK